MLARYLRGGPRWPFDGRDVYKRQEPHISPKSLERLKMPVLVIAGTNDMVKRKHTRLIQSSIKNSRLVLIKGDHFIANRRPEEFNRAVLDFLETT